MSSAYRPTGLLMPVITPFAADGRVDLDTLERLAAELLDAGATALIALSTTAEPSALDPAEREAVVAACARVCADRGAGLVVGAG
ncbi:MAG: dihydrodipicolinate synthase family protein, partial [Solirubrobacterales bacterium]